MEDEEEIFVTTSMAAELIGVSRQSVAKQVSRKTVASVKVYTPSGWYYAIPMTAVKRAKQKHDWRNAELRSKDS